MFFGSHRPNKGHHTTIKYGIGLLVIGILINVVISLWEGPDIGFFSANTVFTSTSVMVITIGLIAVLSKDFNFFFLFGVLGLCNIIFCIQPIVMWTDEGNLCNGLSAAEQQIARECYTAASGTSSSFTNMLTLVTSCYQSNNILTGASGVCYNIRWGNSSGGAIRSFMLISWLCQFFGTVLCLVATVIEISNYGSLLEDKAQIDFLIRKAVLQFYRDTCIAQNKDDYDTLLRLFASIRDKEHAG